MTTSRVADETNAISIYPNPAKNNLHIEGLERSKKYEVSVTNEKGNTFMSAQIGNAANDSFNIQNLKQGVYYISIASGENVVTKKFVKE